MKKYLISTFLILPVLTLTACKSLTITYLPPLPQNLEQPCNDVCTLTDGGSCTLVKSLTTTVHDLNDCKIKHKETVEFYNGIRKLYNKE